MPLPREIFQPTPSKAAVDDVARLICNREWRGPRDGGEGELRWGRLLARAEAWPGCFAWHTVERLRMTAFEILTHLKEHGP